MRLLRHTGIYVSDIELMKDFYCKTFNLSIAVHGIEEGSYIETVLAKKGIRIEVYKLSTQEGCLVELIKPLNLNQERFTEKKIYSLGTHHIAFTVKNIDELFKKMEAQGVVFLSSPQISSDGKAKVCFCKDPEGNFIELVDEK